MIPHSSYYSEVRKTSIQGGSLAVRLPADFARSLRTLNEINLKMLNFDNRYIIYLPLKTSHNDLYDLLQLVLTALGIIYHNVDEHTKKRIETVYTQLVPIQENLK